MPTYLHINVLKAEVIDKVEKDENTSFVFVYQTPLENK